MLSINFLFEKLKRNSRNAVIYYQRGKRFSKSFSELAADVDILVGRLKTLGNQVQLSAVGIIGPTSYEWLVLDLATIKAGIKNVVVPETFSRAQVNWALSQVEISVCFVDETLRGKYEFLEGIKVLYFNSDVVTEDCILSIDPSAKSGYKKCEAIENYSIGFSSGTSKTPKAINLTLPRTDSPGKGFFKEVGTVLRHLTSFWGRRDNRLIVFMPFSHIQQRGFVRTALGMGMDVVLSDPMNCLVHIILERPNVMISVPLVYEVIARSVQKKVNAFKGARRNAFRFYNWSRINTLPGWNPVKKVFDALLFSSVKKLYGGRADYFVTGSARVEPSALKTLYSVGVRVYEGYGQSELGILALNTRRAFRIGSVGKPQMKVKINDDGEIMIEYSNRFDKNRALLNISNGYIHTGDLGYLDKDGFLFLKGRKDDVIVLANGKKVHPELIEQKLTSSDLVQHAVICSRDKVHVDAILSVVVKNLEQKLVELIHSVNEELETYSQITSYVVINERFSSTNGLLTGTFKVRRHEVIERFSSSQFSKVS